MVPSKTHARLGVLAAATVLSCAMSIVLVRSGGARLQPAVRVSGDDTAIASQQSRPLTDAASPADEPLPGSMLVVTPTPDRMLRQGRPKSGI